MLFLESLTDQEPEPEEERHVGLSRVVGQPPGGIEVRLLEDVGGIDPPLEASIEPQGNHAAQPGAAAIEERLPRELVAPRGSLDQTSRLARWIRGRHHHTP